MKACSPALCFARLCGIVFFLLALGAPIPVDAQISGGAWVTETPLPAARLQAAVAVDDLERIYVLGGYVAPSSAATNTVYRFTPGSPGTWETLAPLPIATRGASAVYLAGKIHVYGGFNFGHITAVQTYDIASNAWTSTSYVGAAWENASAVTVGGRIFFLGGEGVDSQTVEFTPPSTFTLRATMPHAMKAHGAAALGDLVYAFGGAGPLAEVDRYDVLTDTWTTAPANLPVAQGQFAYAAHNNHLYVAGGSTSPFNYASPYFSTVYQYNAATDAWTSALPLPVALREAAGAVSGSRFYVLGGYGGANSAAVYSIQLGLPPTVVTEAADGLAFDAASLHASITPNGAATTAFFRYGTDPTLTAGTTDTIGQALGNGGSVLPLTQALSGLLPHTTYYFRAIAANIPGTTNGAIRNFTTLDRAPDAVDDSYPAPLTAPPFTFSVLANDTDPDLDTLTITSVTNGLRGTASTNGTTVTYTPGPGYHGNDTFTYTINDGFGMSDTATVTIYRAPDVLTLAATTVIPSAAILNAVADPRDLSTDVGFQYSTDPGLAGAVLTGTVNVGSGSGEVPVGIPITGLVPNTRYYYRALAASSAGAATGAIESLLTPVVVWGGAGSNAQTGTLDASIIPGTTSTPIRYVNASNQGYDIVATTAGLGGAGLGSIVGTPGWWFEGRAPNVSGYATTTFRFLDSVTNAAVGVTGVRFRLEDAEFTERFANFSYWDALGNKITVNFNNSIFTYSGTPVFSAGGLAVENGVAYQGGTQMGKWIDIDLSTRAISGFEIQARRQTNSAGSVIMSGWGGGALPMNLWRQLKFGGSYTDDTIAGDFADPNGDGIINLLAYAFGIEPLGPASGGLPVTTLTGGYLRSTFSRPQSATDLTYQVEVSGDMILWLPGSKYSASGDIASNANTTQISRTFAGPNEVIVVRDNIPAGSGSRYIRVRVTRP